MDANNRHIVTNVDKTNSISSTSHQKHGMLVIECDKWRYQTTPYSKLTMSFYIHIYTKEIASQSHLYCSG